MLSESLNVDAAVARSCPSGVRKVGAKPGGGQYARKASGKSNIPKAMRPQGVWQVQHPKVPWTSEHGSCTDGAASSGAIRSYHVRRLLHVVGQTLNNIGVTVPSDSFEDAPQCALHSVEARRNADCIPSRRAAIHFESHCAEARRNAHCKINWKICACRCVHISTICGSTKMFHEIIDLDNHARSWNMGSFTRRLIRTCFACFACFAGFVCFARFARFALVACAACFACFAGFVRTARFARFVCVACAAYARTHIA